MKKPKGALAKNIYKKTLAGQDTKLYTYNIQTAGFGKRRGLKPWFPSPFFLWVKGTPSENTEEPRPTIPSRFEKAESPTPGDPHPEPLLHTRGEER